MRLLLLLCTLTLPISAVRSQVILLDRAYDFILNKEFEKAASAIQKAEGHATTANDARTYYLKAFAYKELYFNCTGEQREQYRNMAITSVIRSKDLDHSGSFEKPLHELEKFLIAGIYNDGSEKFNRGEYKEAITLFKRYCELVTNKDEHWLQAKYFIGVSFYEENDIDSAALYLEFVRMRNYDEPLLYVDLAYIYTRKNNKEFALQVLYDGLISFPAYYDLQVAQLNTLMNFQLYDTLEKVIEKFLTKHDDNVEVLLMAGTVYDRNRKDGIFSDYFAKSEQVYRKVLDLDPKNYDANFNLGVLYYNEAVDIVNQSNIDTDIEELTKVLERSTKLFEQALPLLLSIHVPGEENVKLLKALQAIYYNLNMKDELVEVNSSIKRATKTG